MGSLEQIWKVITNLQEYVEKWSDQLGPWMYCILFLIIFCETGLVVMPWLPGDSLLFVAGALCASDGGEKLSIVLLWILLPLAAISGDNVNYWIGRSIGPRIFKREKSIFFNAEILHRTQVFYNRHGGKMVVLARFVPLVRTFAPFVAGIGQMNYPKFVGFGMIGAAFWVLVCTTAGYAFGNIPWVKEHFEIIVLAVIAISIMPAVMAWVQARGEMKRQRETGGGARHD